MKKVQDNIYRLSLTLANNPLKEIHCYIIKGENYSFLMDTGFDDLITRNKILEALSTLNIPIENLKVFISHLHADHAGLAEYFYNRGCEVFASKEDALLINKMIDGSFEPTLTERITLLDLDQYQIDKDSLPKFESENHKAIPFTHLKDQDILSVGDYQFQVLDVSGHTPGMLALYDATNKILFGADHILDQISPNIAYWGDHFPSLERFLNNLQKVIPLEINTLYPSHRNEMADHPKRARELINHHHERLEEVLTILKDATTILSASEVARRMHWNFRAPSWEAFPKPQKFFATHEAMAHLQYLFQQKAIQREVIQNIAYFKIL